MTRFGTFAMAVALAVGCKAKRQEAPAAPPDPVRVDAAAAPAPDGPIATAPNAVPAVPAVPADAPIVTGDLELSPDATRVHYAWKVGSATVTLGVIVEDMHLTVVGPRDGKDVVLLTEREVNAARTTQLRVRPNHAGLAILLVQDWSDEGNDPTLDFAYLLSWDGSSVQVKQASTEELVTPPAWASLK